MKLSKTALAGALVLAFSACTDNNSTMVDSGSGSTADPANSAGDTEDSSRGRVATMDTSTSPTGTGMPAANAAALAQGDRQALMVVMEIDQHEIEAAEVALSKDVQGPARAYAETLRTEHTRNLEATRALFTTGDQTGEAMTTVAGGTASTTSTGTASETENVPPDLADMKLKHTSKREQLAALSGDAFQRAWVDAMAAGHQEALTKLDSSLIPGASDPRVKSHLQTTRTAIAAHLETAKQLQQAAR